MQVILLDRMQNLGALGDTVKVKPGYARNYLIPNGKAVAATDTNRVEFEARRAELERQQADVLDAARARARALEEFSVSIARKAGEEGKLFGSVTAQDIAEAATAAGVELRKQEVRVSHPIRQTGDYEVEVHLHADVQAVIKVTVAGEG